MWCAFLLSFNSSFMLPPHEHRQDCGKDDSDDDVIAHIEKPGEILPMRAQKIAGVEEVSVREEVADYVIKKEGEEGDAAKAAQKVREHVRRTDEARQEYGGTGIFV